MTDIERQSQQIWLRELALYIKHESSLSWPKRCTSIYLTKEESLMIADALNEKADRLHTEEIW